MNNTIEGLEELQDLKGFFILIQFDPFDGNNRRILEFFASHKKIFKNVVRRIILKCQKKEN